jgi:hypothetical protein
MKEATKPTITNISDRVSASVKPQTSSPCNGSEPTGPHAFDMRLRGFKESATAKNPGDRASAGRSSGEGRRV